MNCSKCKHNLSKNEESSAYHYCYVLGGKKFCLLCFSRCIENKYCIISDICSMCKNNIDTEFEETYWGQKRNILCWPCCRKKFIKENNVKEYSLEDKK